MYIYLAMPLLLLVPCLLARRGVGSRWVWFGGSGVFLVVFALGAAAALFGGPQARVADGIFHTATETLIGVKIWTFIGALGFTLAGFIFKGAPEDYRLFVE